MCYNVYVCVCMCMYVYVCVCMCIYVYVCVCIIYTARALDVCGKCMCVSGYVSRVEKKLCVCVCVCSLGSRVDQIWSSICPRKIWLEIEKR